MSTTISPGRPSNPILRTIAVRRRRLVLAILQDQTSPLSERELATHLVAEEGEKSLVAVTSEEAAEVHADLHHVHLPRLTAASLVERDSEAETVTTTNHPVLDDPQLKMIIEADEDGLDAVLANLASQRRRTVLAVLADSDGPMSREDLATAVRRKAEADSQRTSVEPGGNGSTNVLASLHHVHLPNLDETGLVTYDAEEGTAVYEGHPVFETEWFETEWLEREPDGTPLPVVTAARESSDV